MLNNYIEVIDRMHSYSSMMDKISRMSYLRGEQNRLEEMSRQLFLSYRIKGYLTQEEIRCAIQIREMITSVQVEGEKTNAEFNKEWWKEFNKELAKTILNLGR